MHRAAPWRSPSRSEPHAAGELLRQRTADVTFPGATEAEAGAMPEFIGNPTECALLVAAHKAGLDYRIRRERATVLHTYPFSSETKSMTTVVRDGDGITVFAKGSPEKMLDLCAVDARRAAKSNGRSRSSRRSPAECSASPTAIFPIRRRHCGSRLRCDRAGLESGMMFRRLRGHRGSPARGCARCRGALPQGGHRAQDAHRRQHRDRHGHRQRTRHSGRAAYRRRGAPDRGNEQRGTVPRKSAASA